MQGLKVQGKGNLVADPELKYGQKGDAYVHFNLASNEGHYDGEGADRKWVTDRTTFIRCVAFRERAEAIATNLKKGFQVFVEGRLSQNRWEDKDKVKHSMHELLVDAFQVLREPKVKEAEASEAGTGTPS